MSRIIYPSAFLHQRKLFDDIRQKHNADGPASVLLQLLAENEIDMAADAASATAADAHETNFETCSRQSEMLREQRDVIFSPAWKHLKMCVKFLKALYQNNTRKLGEWSITVNNKNHIAYPRLFARRAQLLHDFIAHHNSFAPGSSPLEIFLTQNSINLAADDAACTNASLRHDEFEKASRNKEMYTELRNKVWKPVMEHVRIIGRYVKALYIHNPHRAGDYGFRIDSSRRAHKLRKSKVAIGRYRTLRGLVPGSSLTNLGNDVLHVFKGNRISAVPIVLQPRQKLELAKGYSTTTVFNPSPSENGIFSSVLFQ